MTQQYFLRCAALLAALLFVVGCDGLFGERTEEVASRAESEVTSDPESAPEPPADWSLPAIDADALTALREEAARQGKVLVIDCWASWCSPCKALFPLLHEAMAQRGDDVMLVTITIDEDRREGDAYIQAAQDYLIAQHAWQHAYVAIAGNDARTQLGQAASENWFGGTVPAAFVYAPDGTLAYEMTQTAGDEHDQLQRITDAVDAARQPQGQ